MGRRQSHGWARAAQTLSRSGLLWVALTVVAVSSFLGSNLMPAGARLVAASNLGSTGKLKTLPSGPAVLNHESNRAILHRAQRDPDVKRTASGGAPVGLIVTTDAAESLADSGPVTAPVIRWFALPPSGFDARAPPAFG